MWILGLEERCKELVESRPPTPFAEFASKAGLVATRDMPHAIALLKEAKALLDEVMPRLATYPVPYVVPPLLERYKSFTEALENGPPERKG